MAPCHVLPLRTVGVPLVVEVPRAVLVEHSVGIVHPSVARSVVVGRAESLDVGVVEGIGELHFLPAHVILEGTLLVTVAVEGDVEQYRLAAELTQVEWHAVVALADSKTCIEAFHLFIINYYPDMGIFL